MALWGDGAPRERHRPLEGLRGLGQMVRLTAVNLGQLSLGDEEFFVEAVHRVDDSVFEIVAKVDLQR